MWVCKWFGHRFQAIAGTFLARHSHYQTVSCSRCGEWRHIPVDVIQEANVSMLKGGR